MDCQAAQRGQDLNAVVLPVALGVFPQRHIPHPGPAVFNRPGLSDRFEQSLGAGTQTRDALTGLVLRLALSDPMATHGDDRGAAGPLLHHLVRRRHRPQLPGNVSAPFDFPLAGAPGDSTAVGEPVSDQAKSLAAAMFDGDQEVGVALGEIDEKGRFACSASACTSTPSSSTASSSCRMAWISPLASVA